MFPRLKNRRNDLYLTAFEVLYESLCNCNVNFKYYWYYYFTAVCPLLLPEHLFISKEVGSLMWLCAFPCRTLRNSSLYSLFFSESCSCLERVRTLRTGFHFSTSFRLLDSSLVFRFVNHSTRNLKDTFNSFFLNSYKLLEHTAYFKNSSKVPIPFRNFPVL